MNHRVHRSASPPERVCTAGGLPCCGSRVDPRERPLNGETVPPGPEPQAEHQMGRQAAEQGRGGTQIYIYTGKA